MRRPSRHPCRYVNNYFPDPLLSDTEERNTMKGAQPFHRAYYIYRSYRKTLKKKNKKLKENIIRHRSERPYVNSILKALVIQFLMQEVTVTDYTYFRKIDNRRIPVSPIPIPKIDLIPRIELLLGTSKNLTEFLEVPYSLNQGKFLKIELP